MIVIEYYKILKRMSRGNEYSLRISMVEYAGEKGISKAASAFGTTRKTVRKWVKRYRAEGLTGLNNRSKTPKHIPHKTPKEIEEYVIELREKHPSWGPARLKMHYNLSMSERTIWRIIKQAGLVKKRKRKWQKRKDLREIKKVWKAFEMIQTDVKYLTDIEKYWPQMKALNLPLYQYTARDVRTGASWYAYGYSNNTTNASFFAEYLFRHLMKYRKGRIIAQTDNGSEFIGGVWKKEKSRFRKVLKSMGVKHVRIPPKSPTWNSDVESFHRIIEDEFYECEQYGSLTEFLKKAYTYQIYFNYRRKNRWRGKKTPEEILREVENGDTDTSSLNLPPIILDNLLDKVPMGGYHVPTSVNTQPL